MLTFSEDEFSAAVTGAETWVSINSDGAAVSAQLAAAKQAGVKRVFLHFSNEGELSHAGWAGERDGDADTWHSPLLPPHGHKFGAPAQGRRTACLPLTWSRSLRE